MIICENHEILREVSRRFNDEGTIILTTEYWSGKQYLKNNPSKDDIYYFYYDKEIWNMESRDSIIKLQNLLCEKEDYNTAKVYNEFLMLVTHLKGNSEWLYYPKEIQIEHTNKCNARCIMCGHYNVDKKYCTDISQPVFNALEKFLPFCKHVGLHGYGEPFLTKNLIEYFKVYQKYNIRLYTNSNLSYISDEMLPYISELFDVINVSCDSPDERTYEYIRKGLSYKKFIENIEKVKKNCPNVQLNLFAVLMSYNIDQIEDLIVFAHKYGFASVSLTEMISLKENDNHLDTAEQYPMLRNINLKKAIKKAKELGVEFYYPYEGIDGCIGDVEHELDILEQRKSRMNTEQKIEIIHENNLLFSRQEINVEKLSDAKHSCKGICDVFATQMYCSLDGNLALCCVDGFNYTENIMNINSAESYWNSRNVAAVRRCFEDGRLPRVCNNCNYIILDRLKSLKINDRSAYLQFVNSEGSTNDEDI